MNDPLSQFRLDGDVAVVTGGASGIGRTIAEAFAGVSARVAIFDVAAGAPDGYKVDVTDESAGQGIRVNAIPPTWVRTPLIRPITENPDVMKRIEEITPMGRIAEPEELVGAVLFLASRASAMVTGHVLAVDGGFLAQ